MITHQNDYFSSYFTDERKFTSHYYLGLPLHKRLFIIAEYENEKCGVATWCLLIKWDLIVNNFTIDAHWMREIWTASCLFQFPALQMREKYEIKMRNNEFKIFIRCGVLRNWIPPLRYFLPFMLLNDFPLCSLAFAKKWSENWMEKIKMQFGPVRQTSEGS